MPVARYPIPAGRHRAEQVIARSRGVATIDHAATPDEAHAVVRSVSAEFPDATHHAVAFLAVCTRWYGGTKLGTGGLARAYGGTVQLALQSLPRGERVELVARTVVTGYPHVTVTQQLLAAHEATVDRQEFDTEVRFDIRRPSPRWRRRPGRATIQARRRWTCRPPRLHAS